MFLRTKWVSMSHTYDFENWSYFWHTKSAENVCVLHDNDEYILFHFPKNGNAIKKSNDFKDWTDFGPLNWIGKKGEYQLELLLI
ncbi:MAG: hypothetical protein RLZZ540_385 [Bacteroidota bacterium]|jgi:hypothetical protein